MLEDLIRYYFNLTIKTVDKTEDGILKIKYYLSQIKLGNAIRIFFLKSKASWNIETHNSEKLLKC